MLISFRPYMNYSSDNYGAHCLRFNIGDYTFWFSYRTVVAFQMPGHSIRVSENLWKSTTGKHLNAIDGGDKKSRLPRKEFEKQLEQVMRKSGFTVS